MAFFEFLTRPASARFIASGLRVLTTQIARLHVNVFGPDKLTDDAENSLAHVFDQVHFVFPRLFRFCSLAVAHLQFSGQ